MDEATMRPKLSSGAVALPAVAAAQMTLRLPPGPPRRLLILL